MTKILIYSDLQATEGHERCFNNPILPLQRYRVNKFFEFLRQTYEKYNCDALWDLGDTTDDRNSIPIPTLQALTDGLSWKPRKAYDRLIIGNHGQFVKNTKMHVGSIFKSHFMVVSDLEVLQLEEITVICAAFPENEKELAAKLEVLLTKYRNDTTIVLGHFDVAGCKTKHGKLLTGLTTELLDKATLTLLGHIHLPQKLGENIHYIGSPFQQNFGEAGESKRLGLIMIDGSSIQLDFIPITGFPEYRVVDIDEFTEKITTDSENRYQVVLNNPLETENFYAHPLSNRAQPIYAYNTESKIESSPIKDWSLKNALVSWSDLHDPAKQGINVSKEELLKFGEELVS